MGKSRVRVILLRFVWGLVPWLMVGCVVWFMGVTATRIIAERGRLEEARKAAGKKEIPPARVITLTMASKRFEDTISLPAQVEPEEEVWVKAEVSGQVVAIRAKEGHTLTSGQVLVEIDARDYKNRLARITANYTLARLEYDRNLALARSNATSKSALDSIEAQLKDLEAQQEEAELALSRTSIKAPISCILNEISAKKGDFVGVGDPVAQILQVDRVKVTVGVPESDVAAVFDVREADVIIDALDNRRIRGRKIFLARKPRSLARLYDLELAIPNPDGRILPGMFARVELVKEAFPRALTVPLYAVITQGEETYVFVEHGGTAHKRPVRLGALSGWQVHITSGLSDGDEVIVVGHRALEHGQAVKVIKTVGDAGEILTP